MSSLRCTYSGGGDYHYFKGGEALNVHSLYVHAVIIDQFSFKNVISLCPPCLGVSKSMTKDEYFKLCLYFSSGTGVCLPLPGLLHHLLSALGSSPGMADATFLKLNSSIDNGYKTSRSYTYS